MAINNRFPISSPTDLSALVSSSQATPLQQLEQAITRSDINSFKRLVGEVDISELKLDFLRKIPNEQMREAVKFYRNQQKLYPNPGTLALDWEMHICHFDFTPDFVLRCGLTNEMRAQVMEEVKANHALSGESLDMLRAALLLTPISIDEATWLRAAVKAGRIDDPGIVQVINTLVHHKKVGEGSRESLNDGKLQLPPERRGGPRMTAWCRHLTLLLQEESQKIGDVMDNPGGLPKFGGPRIKSNLASFQDAKSLQAALDRSLKLEAKYKRVLAQATETYFVKNRDFGDVLVGQFEQMEAEMMSEGRDSAGKQFVLESFVHAMNLDLVIKTKENGKKHYVARLYDPNITGDHARLDTTEWEGLSLEGLSTWIEDQESMDLYFDNAPGCMLYRRREEELNEDKPPILDRTVTSCGPLKHIEDFKAALQYFVHKGFAGSIQQLKDQLEKLDTGETFDVLKCEAHPDSQGLLDRGITLPCTTGAVDTILAYGQLLELVPSHAEELLRLRDSDGKTALHHALTPDNYTEVLAAFTHVLPRGSAAAVMMDKTDDKEQNTVLHLAMLTDGQEVAALYPLLERVPPEDRLRVFQEENAKRQRPLDILFSGFHINEEQSRACGKLLTLLPEADVMTLLDELLKSLPTNVKAAQNFQHLLNSKGLTRLHLACNRQPPDLNMVKNLLSTTGNDVNKRTSDGNTPLDLIWDADRRSPIATLLLERGGLSAAERHMDAFKETLTEILQAATNAVDKGGQLLHAAVNLSNANAAKVVLDVVGVDAARIANENGHTPLAVACGKINLPMAKTLLEWTGPDGTGIDVGQRDAASNTVLHWIAKLRMESIPPQSHSDAFALLNLVYEHIKAKVPNFDINAKASDGFSPFEAAVVSQNVDMVRQMLALPYSLDETGRLTSISINPNQLRISLNPQYVSESELSFALALAAQGGTKWADIAKALLNDPRVDPNRAIRWLSAARPGQFTPPIQSALVTLGFLPDRDSWISVLQTWADTKPVGVEQDMTFVAFTNSQLGHALYVSAQSESNPTIRMNTLKHACERFSLALVQQLQQDPTGTSPAAQQYAQTYWKSVNVAQKMVPEMVPEEWRGQLVPIRNSEGHSLFFSVLQTGNRALVDGLGGLLMTLSPEERMERLVPRTKADITSMLASIDAYCSAVQKVSTDLDSNAKNKLIKRIETSLDSAEDVATANRLTNYLRMALFGTEVKIRSVEEVETDSPEERIVFVKMRSVEKSAREKRLVLMAADRYRKYDPATTELLKHDIKLEAFNVLDPNEQLDFVNKLRRSSSSTDQQQLLNLLPKLTHAQREALTPESA
ncbi:ShET2/EspL2 family type III secretion system effector toxin [Noviherbaspirillum sp. Root189]|uniref:ShET2/EspL2 family type III secretion system effector toxin n=1 Tax=Noviherbaspirillum sp. Root189 TaxID=1736487 RepID=UPI00070B9CB9|nr:ShET2/EspL2 family type III secretion system effector toxin [Noviherbaspirillum sp. Root189]KRB88572.1 hypothetical protein ASE07_18585 [Noviherbaspirillum sp. Root189]